MLVDLGRRAAEFEEVMWRTTTAAAALALKRRAWTCDVDARAVSAVRARLGLAT